MTATQQVLAENGRAVLAYMAHEREYDGRAVDGGVVASLLETAMGQALRSLLEPADGSAIAELRASYRRPVTVEAGPLRVDAGILHAGPESALAEARLVDAEGRVFAHATATWALERAARLAA